MTTTIRRIGILTGGGDCPGLNAVIRAVSKAAIRHYGLEVVGIEDGFQGLVDDRMRALSFDQVSGIISRGGTILGTNNRCDPSRVATTVGDRIEYRNVVPQCVEHLRQRRIDALIVIGGDGTMSCAGPFAQAGINCIGVPKTIDNDLWGTDVTFGFHTAVSIATESLDRILTTAASHHRAMVVELMGRNAGWLTLYAGIANGADVILIPEIPFDIEKICAALLQRGKRGRPFSVIAVAEGARTSDGRQTVAAIDPLKPDPVRLGGVGQMLADEIQRRTAIETRTTVLGHVQRGGSPIAYDRILATQFGHAAIQLLMSGRRDRVVVMRAGEITDVGLLDVVNKQRLVPPDHPFITGAKQIDTCFGD